jgi:hypothetical protein
VLTGRRPDWPVSLVAAPASDPHPEILAAYRKVAGQY